jgi:hypothetical protein
MTFDYTYGVEFLEEFKQKECTQYDKTMFGLIKDWVSCTAKFSADPWSRRPGPRVSCTSGP